MTQEEKAKAYDEAIERYKAKQEYESQKVHEFIEYLFPELKESEDNRIRKGLIALLKFGLEDNSVIAPGFNETKEQALAWLEKQKSIDVLDEEERKFADNVDSYRKEIDEAYQKGYDEGVKVILGTQNSTLPKWKYKNDNTPLLRDSLILNKYGCVAKSSSGAIVSDIWVLDFDELTKLPKEEFEKQGEQKPTDKVKPKFKIGDWVVYEEHTYRIHNISLKKYYECLRIDGTVHIFDFEYIDSKSRLWTIRDAKDGDVLAVEPIEGYSSSFMAIYKKQDGEDFDSYCFVGFDGKFYEGENGHSTEEIHPATKEQRDLLFQKMKEAGYEWDAEKKELKKIEQEATKNEELTEFDKAVGVSIGTWNPKTPEQIQSVKSLSNKLLKLAKKQINNEQKPAWSEEDEHRVKDTIYFLDTAKKHYASTVEIDSCINWLKFIKGRVQLQNIIVTDEELTQAKKDAYNDALDKIEYHSGEPTFDDGWSAAIWYLKKRNAQPQNTWKPSSEQMTQLGKYCPDNRPLTSLYEQLKTQKGE